MLWERLPSSYLFSPFLTVDEGAVVGGGEQVFGAVDNDEEEECDNTTSGLSPEEEATSNLEGNEESPIGSGHNNYSVQFIQICAQMNIERPTRNQLCNCPKQNLFAIVVNYNTV